MSEITRDQVHRNKLNPPNPDGHGGFGDRPEDRNKGTWNSKDSISFQYNKLGRMAPSELKGFKPETINQAIALRRLVKAMKEDGLADAKEITDRTEGRAAQAVDITSNGETIAPVLVKFVDE